MNKIRRETRQSVKMTFSPAVLDRDALAVNVARFLQACAECVLKIRARIGSSDIEESNDRLGALLRKRRQRAKRRSAQNSDEFASPHMPTPGSETTSA